MGVISIEVIPIEVNPIGATPIICVTPTGVMPIDFILLPSLLEDMLFPAYMHLRIPSLENGVFVMKGPE